ncbi:hypothetical protein Hdeb2414_s0014g00423261 [Helianthus debilis subsp. tardiflorus]
MIRFSLLISLIWEDNIHTIFLSFSLLSPPLLSLKNLGNMVFSHFHLFSFPYPIKRGRKQRVNYNFCPLSICQIAGSVI